MYLWVSYKTCLVSVFKNYFIFLKTIRKSGITRLVPFFKKNIGNLENTKGIFVKIRSKINEGLDFKNSIFKGSLNQMMI